MKQFVACLLLVLLTTARAPAATIPATIYTDPPAQPKNPASSAVLHVPSAGTLINGLLYAPAGAGPFPTFVFCHGLPGNEKNLDLLQAVRRAGWNAVSFNYHGSWGSPGRFSFAQNPKDAVAVLAYLREPGNAARLRVDTHRLVLAGHSMGGWVTAQVAAGDTALAGVVLVSMGDMGRLAGQPHDKLTALMADNMEALNDVTADSMAHELETNAAAFSLERTAAGLARAPLLALTADDGLAPDTEALVSAVRAKGGAKVTLTHVATDHSWNDHRIALETLVISWLATLP